MSIRFAVSPQSHNARVDLAQSQLQPQGPNEQTITLKLTLRLKDAELGKCYRVELLATGDDGAMQGPEPVSTLSVGASGQFTAYLPFVAR